MKTIHDFRKQCIPNAVFRFYAADTGMSASGSYRVVTRRQGNGVFWLDENKKEQFFRFPKQNRSTFINGIIKIFKEKTLTSMHLDDVWSEASELLYMIQKVEDPTIIHTIVDRYTKESCND